MWQKVILVLTLVVAMAQLARAVVSVDFEGPFVPVKAAPNSRGVVDGEICPPLVENSSGWANVDMHFSRLTDGAFSGKASQRVEVTAIREGRAQAWIPLESVEPGRYARIRLAARAPSSGSLELSVRLAGAPYTSMWEKRIALSPEWQRFDLTIPAIQYRPDSGYVLMLYFGTGITDIDDLSVEFIDVQKLITNAPKREGNLIASSSFPIGVPSPWSMGSGPIGGSIATDAATPGPTGMPSLKLSPGFTAHSMPYRDEIALISPPLALNQCRPHTISLYLKGSVANQRVSVQLGGANGPSDRRDLTIGADWKRYDATVKLPYIVDGFMFLRVDSDKAFWLDGLQLEESEKASDFRRASKPDLQLSASKSFGLYMDDEPLALTYAVVGDVPAGAMLAGNLVDAYGHKTPIGPMACKSSKGAPVEAALAQAPFGTFIAELRLTDGNGNALSDWSETVVHRIRAPRMVGRDAPDSPFGIHIDPIPAYAEMVKKLGFNWVRIHDAAAYVTKWYFLEDKPDHFDFGKADAGVKVFRDANLMILGMLDTSPTWRSRCERQDWFSKYHLPTAESMPKWSAYCRDIVARYKNDIHDWEVWNEPYVNDFFRLRDTSDGYVAGTPADYVKLLAPAYAAAKLSDPDCNVLWADAVGKWSQGCCENKAYEHCDQASYHNYTSLTPLSFLDFGSAMKDMRSNMPEQYRKITFWNTEGGVGGTNDTHILSHTAKPGDMPGALEQAEFLVRYQIASQVYGAKRFFLYTFHYHGWNASWDLLLPDGSLPPHASAQSNLMWHLEGRRYTSTVPLNSAYSAYLFAGKDADVVVVMAQSQAGNGLAVPKLSDGCVLRNFFGNDVAAPVKLDRSVWYITTPAGQGEMVAKSLVQ